MRVLIIALGSVGQAVAERLSRLAAGCLEERITYSFVSVDCWRQPRLSGRQTITAGQASVVVPVRPLLGEALVAPEVLPIPEAEGLTSELTPLQVEALLDATPERLQQAIEATIDRGGFRGIERAIDGTLYVDARSADGLHVVLVGAACDPLVVQGVPLLINLVKSYLEERYQRRADGISCLLLSTDCIADAFARRSDRERLRTQEALLVSKLLNPKDKADDGADKDGAADKAEARLCLIPATNAAGRRLASAEDYCLEAAGLLASELAGVWQTSLFADGPGSGHGVVVVERPAEQIERCVALGVARDAISFWTAVDDLWNAGSWDDFGLGPEHKGSFYRGELRRLAAQERYANLATCLRQLEEEADGGPSAGDTTETLPAEERLAAQLLATLDELAHRQVREWAEGGTGPALTLPQRKARKLPQTADDVRAVYEVRGTADALSRRWLASLEASERRHERLADLQATLASTMDALLSRRDLAPVDLGLPEGFDALHPVTARSLLYACAEVVGEAAERARATAEALERQVGQALAGEIDYDLRVPGVQDLHEAILVACAGVPALPTDIEDEGEDETAEDWAPRLAGLGYVLNACAARIEELATAMAERVVLGRVDELLSTLVRHYELLFKGAYYLEHDLDRELAAMEAAVARRRGSVYLPVGSEKEQLDRAIACCEERLSDYPVAHLDWTRLNRTLRDEARGLVVRQDVQEQLLLTSTQAKEGLLRSVLMSGSGAAGSVATRLHDMLASDLLEALDRGAPSGRHEGPRELGFSEDLIEEALCLAEPFGAGGPGLPTRDTLVSAGPLGEAVLSKGNPNNGYHVLEGMNEQRLLVCRERCMPSAETTAR